VDALLKIKDYIVKTVNSISDFLLNSQFIYLHNTLLLSNKIFTSLYYFTYKTINL